jgi:ribosome recycling factor
MAKAISALSHEFSTVRTGRASGAIFDKIHIDYYGASTPLLQLAAVSSPEPQLVVISPYDKTILKAAEKAILASDLGLNPSNDGRVIRLSFPVLTSERRKEYVKMVKHMAEEGRVAIRSHRRGARHELEGMEKDGDISADEMERAEKELDKVTAGNVAAIDTALEHKERELLGD